MSEAVSNAQERYDLVRRITVTLVEGLDLPDDPEVIDPDQPLFGRGLDAMSG